MKQNKKTISLEEEIKNIGLLINRAKEVKTTDNSIEILIKKDSKVKLEITVNYCRGLIECSLSIFINDILLKKLLCPPDHQVISGTYSLFQLAEQREENLEEKKVKIVNSLYETLLKLNKGDHII